MTLKRLFLIILTVNSKQLVDLDLANSLVKIQDIVTTYKQANNDPVRHLPAVIILC